MASKSNKINSNGWVPQRRVRLYIIALKNQGNDVVEMCWPSPREADRVQMKDIFDKDAQTLNTYTNYPLPPPSTKGSTRKRDHIAEVLKKVQALAQKKCNPVEIPVIVDTGSSNLNWAVGESPTITKSRGQARDFWSLQHGRPLTVVEMLRLQGFPVEDMDLSMLSHRQIGLAAGSSHMLPIAQALLKAAMKAVESAGQIEGCD